MTVIDDQRQPMNRTCIRNSVRQLPGLALFVALVALSCHADDKTDHEIARRYSTCAAYYFNGTQAVPMSEYERYYSAGEVAFNEASRLIGREQADRLAGDASVEMKTMIDGDWQQFEKLEQTYSVTCADLIRAVADQ